MDILMQILTVLGYIVAVPLMIIFGVIAAIPSGIIIMAAWIIEQGLYFLNVDFAFLMDGQ